MVEDNTRSLKVEGIASEEWESRKKAEGRRAQHERYDFIDQFRGLTVLFLAISWITWELGKMHLVPPIIDHGWQFVNADNVTWNWLDMENQFYTIIDLGSSLFMFVLGVTIPISFRSKQRKFGTAGALGRLSIRVGAFIGLQAISDEFNVNYRGLLLGQDSTLSALGLGTLIGGLSVLLVKNPDKRVFIAIGLMCLHGTLYLIPDLAVFRHNSGTSIPWMGSGTFFDAYMIPFELMSFGAISIMGTCFWDWFNKENPVEAIKKRHLPVAAYSLVFCFVIMWFIPFEHHDLSVSQDLLAIAAGYFLLVLFFSMEYIFKFKLPLLTPMGRNALILYIVGVIPGTLLGDLGLFNLLTPQVAWFGLVLCAFSIALVGFVGWMLDKKKIYLRI
ncbi:MAG TPA: hypothetical protein VKM55_18675 [Candidatus Lokiarchaeia archaeon]|nr:hypothetical protein [Candidatus Lokiarchaeia archaeon]